MFTELCLHADQCPDFVTKQERLSKLDKSSSEYAELLEVLRGRVCDKEERRVCCWLLSFAETQNSTCPGEGEEKYYLFYYYNLIIIRTMRACGGLYRVSDQERPTGVVGPLQSPLRGVTGAVTGTTL